jgi:ferredoxin
MPDLKIDGVSVSVESGATVLAAADLLGIEIPTLCHLKDCAPETSCMLCVVKETATGQLIPACSARATDGMDVDTQCDEVLAARRNVLNLLLSEHVGDCEAPCERICPAHLEIPLMLREIERGNLESAGWIARRDLAIPVALGYICPAPCEKGCRRSRIDSAIPIRDLHRDAGRACSPEWTARRSGPAVDKKAAIVGSGPAGLSCAWNLLLLGYDCTVFDEASVAGGALRDCDELPADVLDAEIEWLKAAGIHFKLNASPNPADVDAVVAPEEHKLAVMAVANGKAAALMLAEVPENPQFDCKAGRLRDTEARELMKNCSVSEDGELEAARCLHCDCRKPVSCKLRKYAQQYGADQREFPADERKHVQVIGSGESVIFEPGKCIKCGLCVKITKRAGEALGVTFSGRGYNTQVVVPFGEPLRGGLQQVAAECVAACPTGALAFREGEER